MTITIDPWDKKSIDEAIRLLDAYEKSLSTKEGRLIDMMLIEGQHVANEIYAAHPGDHGTGYTHFTRTGSEGILEATAPNGEIGFIEFGTGINHPEWNSVGMAYTPPEHGSYGLGQGKDPGYWYYGGKITDGRDPAEAMLYARSAMIETLFNNAREVFGSD